MTDTTTVLTKQEWLVSLRQLLSLRAFWKRRPHTQVCGESWVADYGPLPCDLPHGHSGQHRTYGSQGPLLWQRVKERISNG